MVPYCDGWIVLCLTRHAFFFTLLRLLKCTYRFIEGSYGVPVKYVWG
jgi:hypothetical protein